MNCELSNLTSLPASLHFYKLPKQEAQIAVIAKATWQLSTGRLAAAESQEPVRSEPLRIQLGKLDIDDGQRRALGDRQDEEVVWLDHDLTPPKPAFDVIVAGYVTPPPGWKRPSIRASVQIGAHTCALDAYVPRYWKIGFFRHSVQPIYSSLRRVPLSYAVSDCENGFPVTAEFGKHQRLPWLVAAGAKPNLRKHAKRAAGFGHWPESAPHRAQYAGTYDEDWQKTRQPDLPLDFDSRYFNTAHPDLQLPAAPASGTTITLKHLSNTPEVRATMPALALEAQSCASDGQYGPRQPMRADTLILEPDLGRYSLIYRTAFSAGNGLRGIRLLPASR